jgi:hypothetical protein
MNSDDVKRLRMWHEAASRAEELTPLTNREISDLLAAAEERDRLRRDAKVVLDGAIRASVDRDRALTAARELREALNDIGNYAAVVGSPTDKVHKAAMKLLRDKLKSTAWLTDGGDSDGT